MNSFKGWLELSHIRSVFTDLGECYCKCEKSRVKPTKWFQRNLHKTASSDVTHRQSCIVDNVCARFWRGRWMHWIKKPAISFFFSILCLLSIKVLPYCSHLGNTPGQLLLNQWGQNRLNFTLVSLVSGWYICWFGCHEAHVHDTCVIQPPSLALQTFCSKYLRLSVTFHNFSVPTLCRSAILNWYTVFKIGAYSAQNAT